MALSSPGQPLRISPAGYLTGMPVGGQPSGRRTTAGHPYSRLGLRRLRAVFGLVGSVVLAALLMRAGAAPLGWLFVALALVTLVDLVVSRHATRASRRTGRQHRSLSG